MHQRFTQWTFTMLAVTGLVGCGGGSGAVDAGKDAGRDADAATDTGSGGRGGGGSGGQIVATGGAGAVAGTGGGTATGGASGSAGISGAGGTVASGGVSGVGGVGGAVVGTGGVGPGTGGRATGGAVATGGVVGSGGAVATGGRMGTGGVLGTGGSVGTGGRGTGGSTPGTGGVIGTGGVLGTGGVGTGGVGTGGVGTGGVGTGGVGTGGVGTGGVLGTGGAGTGGAGTGGAGTGGAGTGGAGTGGAGGTTFASLYVVAHPDDELLFMNPDLENDILAGRAVTTVYTTSGDGARNDGQGLSVATTRETNVRSAHAGMAAVADNWSCGAATYAGKTTQRCVLNAHPSVRAIYLRILDGEVNVLRTGGSSGTIDGSGTYTGAQLTAVLAAIQAEVQPGRVGTLDGTLAHGPDHVDHLSTGMFAFDVARADGVARQVTMYRGYSMFEPTFVGPPKPANEAENLSPAQYTEKLRIVHFYQNDPLDAPFDQWCHRMYPISGLTGGAAPLHSSAGECLQESGTADGSAVVTATCNGAAAQNWILSNTGHVTDAAGKCLGIASGGNGLVVETCSGATDQKWTLLSDGALKGSDDQCATVSGSAVSSATCAADMSQALYRPLASQRWNL